MNFEQIAKQKVYSIQFRISILLTQGDKKIYLGFIQRSKYSITEYKADACTRVGPVLYTCINIIIVDSSEIICHFQSCLIFLTKIARPFVVYVFDF